MGNIDPKTKTQALEFPACASRAPECVYRHTEIRNTQMRNTLAFHVFQSSPSAGGVLDPTATADGHLYSTFFLKNCSLMSRMNTRNRLISMERRMRSFSKGSSSGRSAGTKYCKVRPVQITCVNLQVQHRIEGLRNRWIVDWGVVSDCRTWSSSVSASSAW